VIQFASPEYAYQPDDIKDILNTYKSSIKLEHVVSYNTPGSFVNHVQSLSEGKIQNIATGYNDTIYCYVSSNQSYKPDGDDMAYRFRLATSKVVSSTYKTYLKTDLDTVG
jgi:uncharacterized membrane protein